MFQEYSKKGIIVIPEKESRPLVKWSKYNKTNQRPSEAELQEWDNWKDVNYGLLTGQASNVVAVDVDYDDKELVTKIKKALGETPCAKFGTKGITLFYKYNGEENKTYGEVEVKSTGGKVTIPPSKIPDYKSKKLEGDKKRGKSYVWVGATLIDSIDNLPCLPVNYKEKLISLLNIIEKEPEYKVKPQVYFNENLSEADIERALNYLDPNCSYDKWKAIGASLFNELGDAGFYYFDNWSSKGSSYKQEEMKMHWRGCKTFSRYSIGTLIYFATEAGFVLREREFKEIDERELARQRIEEEKEGAFDYPDFYLEAPPHIKAIADWICKSAYIPQPTLSLGVACGLVGFTMLGKYKFSGVKSNMYCINIARTATGKEHILQCANGLFDAIKLKGDHTGSRFTSDTAIIQGLKRTKGTLCYVADEVQTLLRAVSNSNKNSPEAKAEGILLSAYTGSEVSGMEYADKKQTEEKGGTIQNPFLSILGFTTPASFYSSIGMAQKSSGLVGRLTVFEGLKILPEEPNDDYDGDAPKNPPMAVVEYLSNIIQNTYTNFSYNGAKMPIERPIVVSCDDEVKKALKELQREIFRERNELYYIGDDDSENALLRKTEIIKKYCLIASGGEKITMDHYNWAVKVADYNSSIMLKAAGEFGSYEFAGKIEKLYEYIKMRGSVSKSQITNSLRIFKDGEEREKALRELQEAEKIRPVLLGSKKGKKKQKGFEIIVEDYS